MTDRISFDIFGISEIEQYFTDLPVEVHTAMLAKMKYLAEDLETYIVLDKLSGQVLNYISGKLVKSIRSDVEDHGEFITATISAGDSEAPYAGLHEHGGVVHSPNLTTRKSRGLPGTANALQFRDGRIRASSRAHDIPIPERSYMRSALQDQAGHIRDGLRDEFIRTMHEHLAKSASEVFR